jgi:hypothetical protein
MISVFYYWQTPFLSVGELGASVCHSTIIAKLICIFHDGRWLEWIPACAVAESRLSLFRRLERRGFSRDVTVRSTSVGVYQLISANLLESPRKPRPGVLNGLAPHVAQPSRDSKRRVGVYSNDSGELSLSIDAEADQQRVVKKLRAGDRGPIADAMEVDTTPSAQSVVTYETMFMTSNWCISYNVTH